MDLKRLIGEYLADAKLMQLATLDNGQPWVCSVNYVHDAEWNLYWLSLRSRRHSRELLGYSKVAGAIIKDPSVKRGLQFEGVAREVDSQELLRVHELYCESYGNKPERLAEARSGKQNSRTYYALKLTNVVLYDEVNFPADPRREYKLLN